MFKLVHLPSGRIFSEGDEIVSGKVIRYLEEEFGHPRVYVQSGGWIYLNESEWQLIDTGENDGEVNSQTPLRGRNY